MTRFMNLNVRVRVFIGNYRNDFLESNSLLLLSGCKNNISSDYNFRLAISAQFTIHRLLFDPIIYLPSYCWSGLQHILSVHKNVSSNFCLLFAQLSRIPLAISLSSPSQPSVFCQIHEKTSLTLAVLLLCTTSRLGSHIHLISNSLCSEGLSKEK